MAITGKALRLRRLALGYTQQELAERAGVPRATLAAIELNNIMTPSPESLARIIAVLDADTNFMHSADSQTWSEVRAWLEQTPPAVREFLRQTDPTEDRSPSPRAVRRRPRPPGGPGASSRPPDPDQPLPHGAAG